MARSVQDGSAQPRDGEGLTVGEGSVRRRDLRRGDSEPGSLNVHHLYQGKVVLVVEDGGAGEALEVLGPRNVVDVGVGDNDVLHGESVSLEDGLDGWNVVAGIDDDSLARGFVAKDGAVALEQADGKYLVNHVLKITGWGVLERQRKTQARGLRFG